MIDEDSEKLELKVATRERVQDRHRAGLLEPAKTLLGMSASGLGVYGASGPLLRSGLCELAEAERLVSLEVTLLWCSVLLTTAARG